MTKQTAVQFIVNELHALEFIEDITDELLLARYNDALQMFQKQIEEAYNAGKSYRKEGKIWIDMYKSSIDYYTQAYGDTEQP